VYQSILCTVSIIAVDFYGVLLRKMIDLCLIIEQSPLKISTLLQTQTQLDTVNTYISNIHNIKQAPRDINELQLRIVTDIFKI